MGHDLTATCYPSPEHVGVVITLHRVGDDTYPVRAECNALDTIPTSWLQQVWKCEPGYFWAELDCCHAIVQRAL